MFDLRLIAEAAVETSSFWDKIYDKATDIPVEYGPKILAAIAIFIIGRWLAQFVRAIIGKAMTKSKIEPTLVKFTQNLTFAIIMAMIIVSAISTMGIATTSFVAVIGAAGLAIGLALQGSLANFASGVLLVIFKPFKVGDFIEAAGIKGTVQEIQIFTTIIHTSDNVKIIVPNGHITSGSIRNFSANENRRVDMIFGISYKDDIARTKQIILDIMTRDSRVFADPAPIVKVVELADSSVNLAVRPWVKASDYWNVLWDMNETVKNELESQGINIPFPQRDIHIYQEKPQITN